MYNENDEKNRQIHDNNSWMDEMIHYFTHHEYIAH